MRNVFKKIADLFRLPETTVNLMYSATRDNDPFYAKVVREFHDLTRRRHRKIPVLKEFEYGVALCQLPPAFEGYLSLIEASARRNWKKCERNGYTFVRINFNEHLADIGAIRKSAAVRQGTMPRELTAEPVTPCADPPSRTNVHDYPYFGILKENRLAAYAGCLVAGEAFMIEQIYGHADHLADGIVPALIIGMARHIRERYPMVKYYIYGTYFGAGMSMRRFKKKFHFLPHRVTWVLGDEGMVDG